MEPHYVLLYGGETVYNGKRLGLESLFRCNEIVDLVELNPDVQFNIILAAGSHPIHKEYPQLKVLMKRYLRDGFSELQKRLTVEKPKLVFCMPNIILLEEDVWNSSNESLATALYLETLGVMELLVVSSETHRRRIEYIWSLFDGFSIYFIGAPTKNVTRSVAYEIAAMTKVYFKDRKLLRQRKFSTFQAASLAHQLLRSY